MPTAPPLHGPVRWVRTGVLGAVWLTLAAVAHLAGGGSLPGPGLAVVLAFLVASAAVQLTARRCRLPVLTAALTAEQIALHVVLSAAGGCGVASADHHPAMTCAPASAMHAGLPMLLAHLLATLMTAWLLARGEAALWRAADAVAAALSPRAPGTLRRPGREVAVPGPTAAPAADGRRTSGSRGPPLALATAG